MNNNFLNLLMYLSCLVILSGCTGLFFHPYRAVPFTPSEFDYNYKLVKLNQASAWYITPANRPLGAVLFLHGNAGNVAWHFPAYIWLVDRGYDVLALDYRGFGLSDGAPGVEESLEDIKAAYEWLRSNTPGPHFVYGQSLGASLGAYYTAVNKPDIKLLVLESGFSDYRKVAREKLKSTWLTAPLSWPLSFLIDNDFSPMKVVHQITDTPVLLVHAKDDIVVDFEHSEDLFNALRTPKQFWQFESGGHTSGVVQQGFKDRLIDLMKSDLKNGL